MDKILEYAYAKLNISLDVVSKMDNGYHAMSMVMQSTSLLDELAILKYPGTGRVNVTTNRSYLPENEKNLAGAAAVKFMHDAGITDFDVKIEIKKKIPVCAGLGGGSSDAAAVIRGMNKIFETKLTQKTLEKMGEAIGSDVPFCVTGGTKLAEGRGEVLSELEDMPECHIVICKPNFSFSTPVLFSKIDTKRIKVHPDTEGMIKALNDGELREVCCRMYNVFEDVLPTGRGEIEKIKGTLLDNGAMGAMMSGTGSAVFGVFSAEEKACGAFAELKKHYRDVFLTNPTKKLNV